MGTYERKMKKYISPDIDPTISTEQTVELVYTNPQDIEETIEEVIPKSEIVINNVEETIHDKYRSFINQAKEGYVRGFEYPAAMEILRWSESKVGRSVPLNMSCASCLIELISLFARLENK